MAMDGKEEATAGKRKTKSSTSLVEDERGLERASEDERELERASEDERELERAKKVSARESKK